MEDFFIVDSDVEELAKRVKEIAQRKNFAVYKGNSFKGLHYY